MSQSNDRVAIVAWMQRATPGLMPTERDINVDIPAGWTHLVRETCRELETPAWPDDGHVPPTVNAIGTHDGRLVVELDGGTEEDRAIVEVARALSGETCEGCAKKGDPIEDPSGTRGCRCRDCRTPAHRQLPRVWTPPWTDEERAREPRTDRVMRMMAANDDDKWTHQWPEMPGWTGLLRALVIADATGDGRAARRMGRAVDASLDEGEVGRNPHGEPRPDRLPEERRRLRGNAERDALPHVRGTGHNALLHMGPARMRHLLCASPRRGC